MGYLSKRKFEEREHFLITGLVFLIPILTVLCTLGRSLNWRLDYLGEFKMQTAGLSFILCFWCLFKKNWEKMFVFLICAALNLILMASHSYLMQKKIGSAGRFARFYRNVSKYERRGRSHRSGSKNDGKS